MTYDELLNEVEKELKEEGIYFDWLKGHISNNDYEEQQENLIVKKIEKYNSIGIISLVR